MWQQFKDFIALLFNAGEEGRRNSDQIKRLEAETNASSKLLAKLYADYEHLLREFDLQNARHQREMDSLRAELLEALRNAQSFEAQERKSLRQEFRIAQLEAERDAKRELPPPSNPS